MASVRESMSQDFITLDPQATAAQAIEQLRQQSKPYGIIPDPQVGLPVLVTTRVLSRLPDQQARLEYIAEQLPRPTTVQPEAMLEQVARMLATDLVTKPNVTGLVVSDDQQNLVGVIPRHLLARAAAGMVERGGDISELAGDPIGIGADYICPLDGEERLISFYDPDDPPTCSQGHRMKRK